VALKLDIGPAENLVIIDGLTGKTLKIHSSPDNSEDGIAGYAVAGNSKDYCIVRNNGNVEYFNESHDLCTTYLMTGDLYSTRDYMASVSDDLSRVLWVVNKGDSKERIIMLFDRKTNTFNRVGPYNIGYRVAEGDFMLQNIRYLPEPTRDKIVLTGPLDTSLMNLEPQAAKFLWRFNTAIELVSKERKRVEDEIESHRLKNKGKGYVYFPSCARIIMFEGSLLHKRRTKATLSI
jgi:hypothetical protein